MLLCRNTALGAIVLTFGLMLASPSYSFSSVTPQGEANEALMQLGNEFQGIADSFNCHNLASAEFTGKHSASLEFEGDAAKKLDVDYFALSGDAAKDTALLEALRGGLYKQFYEATQILTASSYDDQNKGPVMYIEFRAGKGDAKQYGAGILFRVSAKGAAFIQIQSKGQAFEAADGQKLQDLVKTVVALK